MRLLLVGLLFGCDGGPTDGPTGTDPLRPEADLVDMGAWTNGDASIWADPFPTHAPPTHAPPTHAPPDAACPASGAVLEGASLEVLTGICTYAWFQQPALDDLIPGDIVEVVLWHSALVAEGEAEAHIAYTIGDSPLYERFIPIPSDPAAYTDKITVGVSASKGDIITLHLHNHGANDWNLLRVQRQ